MASGQLSRETEVNRSVVLHIYHLVSQDRRWHLQEGCASLGCSIVMCQQGRGPGLASLSGHVTMKCTPQKMAFCCDSGEAHRKGRLKCRCGLTAPKARNTAAQGLGKASLHVSGGRGGRFSRGAPARGTELMQTCWEKEVSQTPWRKKMASEVLLELGLKTRGS